MTEELRSRVNLQVDFTLLPDSSDITAQRMAEMVETYFGVQLEAPVRAKVVSAFVVGNGNGIVESDAVFPQEGGDVIEWRGNTYVRYVDEDAEEDNHCESDGSGQCLVHFGNFGVIGGDHTEVCDLSPDWVDV